MLCDKKTKPVFTEKQITECHQCMHASKKKIWCCLFGVPIKSKIITPNKKIQYPSKLKMARSFTKGVGKHVLSGLKNRTAEEQKYIMTICKKCPEFVVKTNLGPRCKKCGCCMTLKKRWATSRCPLGKWGQ